MGDDMAKDWFDIELSSLPTIKIWDDWEQKILKPLSYLKEMESKWILKFDLPLVEKKDINVYLAENNMIVVEAKLKERYIDVFFLNKREIEFQNPF